MARNVLLIMVDQWRWDLSPGLGNPLVATPALDRLAARGALYGQWRRQEQVAAQLARRALPVVSGGPGRGTEPPPARRAAE